MELDVIYNEDCYEGIKKIPDKSIDLVYIDPPYLYQSGFGDRLQQIGKQNNLKNLSDGIDLDLLNQLCRVMKHIYIYIWCNDKQIIDYMNFFVNEKKCDYKILGWCKSNPMPMYSCRFLDDVEYCLLFKDKNAKMSGNDTYNNSFRFYNGSINIKDKELYKHPTIKPIDIVKNHIEKTTKEGDVVLDCFIGSGTTAVACKELNRHYIGFELNPEYYQIAIDRVNGLSQKDKKQKENGILNIFDFGVEL